MKMRVIFLLLLVFPLRVRAEIVAHLDSIEGTVEYRTAGESRYQAAKAGMDLAAGDVVHTTRGSRAGIVFTSGTLLRVAQNTTLEVKSPTRDEESVFLKVGKLFLFNRADGEAPIVRTPAVTASIRGTEFVIETSAQESSIGVIEGAVELKNKYGVAALNAGEAGRARSDSAPVKELLIKDASLVDWALYYPAEISPAALEGGFSSAAGKAAFANLKRGESGRVERAFKGSSAEASFGRAVTAYLNGQRGAALKELSREERLALPEARVLRAALSLSLAGDVSAAERDLEAAQSRGLTGLLASTATSLRALVALVRGDKVGAERDSLAAMEAQGNTGVDAALVRSMVLQSRGDITAAKKLLGDLKGGEQSGAVQSRRAELALAEGDLSAARALAASAVEVAPDDYEVRSIHGFVALARGELDQAEADFSRLISSGASSPRVRLGLGLVRIRRGDMKSGRELLSQAAAMDPQVALYRSYLGKALFEDEDEQRALTEFDLAIERDQNDPTPYLYRAFTLLALNRPVDALRDVESAIERNDNRAVYRSRLLLDRDEAVRSAGLGEIFTSLGFSTAARVEALKSLNKDYGNYSAHRLLADSYLDSPFYLDDTSRSENAIARLLSPLSFNLLRSGATAVGADDYSALFERSEVRVGSDVLYETDSDRVLATAWGAGKGEQYGYFTSWTSELADGSKSGAYGRRHEGEISLQFQPSWETRFLLSGIGTYASQYDYLDDSEFALDRGELEGAVVHTFSPALKGFVDVRFGNPRQDFSNGGVDREVVVTSVEGGEVFDEQLIDAPFAERSRERVHQVKTTAQLVYDSSLVSTVVGASHLRSQIDREEDSQLLAGYLDFPLDEGLPYLSRAENSLMAYDLYLYPTIHLTDAVDLTAGVNFTEVQVGNTDVPPFVDGEFSVSHVSPKVGVRVTPWQGGSLRAAFFESVRKASREDQVTLEPTQIGGINQIFTELPGTLERTWGVGADQKIGGGTYVGVEGSRRHLIIPGVDVLSSLEIDYDQATITRGVLSNGRFDEHRDVDALRSYAYHVFSPRWVATIDQDFFQLEGGSVTGEASQETVRVGAALRYFDPSGWYGSFGGTFRNQDVDFGFDEGSENSAFWLLDTGVGYRFPHRKGRVFLGIVNLLDEQFTYDQSSGIEPFLPRDRGVRLTASVNF